MLVERRGVVPVLRAGGPTWSSKTPVRPRALRSAPASFRTGLDAVLDGVDGNTYLFKGRSCYDVRLGREFPLAEDWGRPRNTVADGNGVDAAFVGRDGKTYVFSGDQFVVYPGSTYPDAEIEGPPRPISEHWGGLSEVALAYVQDGLTYLFERPDALGNRRYVVYSGPDYAQPDPGYPRPAGPDVWGIPEEYGRDGFAPSRRAVRPGQRLLPLRFPVPAARVVRRVVLPPPAHPAVAGPAAGYDLPAAADGVHRRRRRDVLLLPRRVRLLRGRPVLPR